MSSSSSWTACESYTSTLPRSGCRPHRILSSTPVTPACRDYNKYFDAIPTRTPISGVLNAQYAEFSGKALAAAQARLDAFLMLVPSQARADAQSQMLKY